MRFQRLSERVESKSRPPESRRKVVPQSRTGGRETPITEFVMCSRHEQLPHVDDDVVAVTGSSTPPKSRRNRRSNGYYQNYVSEEITLKNEVRLHSSPQTIRRSRYHIFRSVTSACCVVELFDRIAWVA